MVAPARTAPPCGPRLALAPLWYAGGGLMLAAVAVVSLLPMPDTGVNDKFAHVVVYCGLSGYFALLVTRRSLPWVLLGLIGYGLLLEWLQGMTDFRYAELADNFANAGGATLGLLAHFTPLRALLGLIDGRLAQLLVRRGFLRRGQ